MYGYFNGTILPADQIQFGITDLGLLRGFGLFDYFRTYNGRPFQWNWYWERFANSAAKMHLSLPIQKDEAYQVVMTLIEKSELPEAAIRFVLTGGYSPDSISVVTPNLLMVAEEIHMTPESQYQTGIKVILDEYVREMAEVKSTDYKHVILLAQEMKAAGASDVLYHKNGEISELSRSNFFLFKGNRLITPNRHILHGITRRTILQLAQNDFEIEERPVLLTDLQDAGEAFTTSTTKWALPIVQVGNTTIGEGKPGERTLFLLDEFRELITSW